MLCILIWMGLLILIFKYEVRLRQETADESLDPGRKDQFVQLCYDVTLT